MSTNVLTFFREVLVDNGVDVFVAVGEPQGGAKYHDYFSESSPKIRSEQLIAEGFFLRKAGKRVGFSVKPQFQFFRLTFEIDEASRTAYVIYVPNWPDHALPEFNKGDLEVLIFLAEYVPKMAAHCSAGLGRSPTLLAMLIGYKIGLFDDPDEDAVVKRYREIVSPSKIRVTC